MQPRTIEFLPTPGNRCFACVFKDDEWVGGVFCEDIQGGRKVKKYGGTELLDELVIGASIMHCLQNSPVSEDDFRHLSLTMGRFLGVHRNNFLQANPDSPEILRPNEPNGVASEIIVYSLLSNNSIFPWVRSCQLVSRSALENNQGIDIIINLSQEIGALLSPNSENSDFPLFIQVKSDPAALDKFIKKHERKNHLKEGRGRAHLIEHNFILLNGGAGRVRDIAVIVPFVAQLHQLICLNNSNVAGDIFLQSLSLELRTMLKQPAMLEILHRDYSSILDLEHLSQSVLLTCNTDFSSIRSTD